MTRIRTVSLATAVALVTGVLVAGGSPAAAAVSCTFHASTGVLDVDAPAHGDAAVIATTDTGELRVNGSACAGGPASVLTTDRISVSGGPGDQRVTLDAYARRFAPGASAEAASPEIEIQIALGNGDDVLRVEAGPGHDRLQLGTAAAAHRINLNANESGGLDHDVTLTGVDFVVVEGREGNDRIRAAGGWGTGDPLRVSTSLDGGFGIDRVSGGAQDDAVSGGPGGDVIRGGGAGDDMFGGPGDDQMFGDDGPDSFRSDTIDGADEMFGGDGRDVAIYAGRDLGVEVSLDNVANDGHFASTEGDNVHADVEDLTGGDGDDQFFGTPARNAFAGFDGADRLFGDPGDDRLEGGRGPDVLNGEEGEDTLIGNDGGDTFYASGDGTTDHVFGGAGEDSCICGPEDEQEDIP